MDICEILLKGTVTFITGVGAAWVGIQIFYRQKEYELVKARYLEGSLDVISSELEDAIGILNHNWARCLNVVKAFRDEKESFDVDELSKGFIEFDNSKFQSIAHHRLQNLIGSAAFWKSFQLALSFVNSSNAVITKEITETIKLKIQTEKISMPIPDMTEKIYKELKEINDKSHRYGLITYQLQLISDEFEKEKMSLRNLKKFRKNQIVLSAITAVEAEFKKEYSEYDE